jgi:protein-disulfide isomerase
MAHPFSSEILALPVGPDDHVRGRADAPITLVEYGDYENAECGLAYLILQQVLEEVGDHVRFVFRNFPIADQHPHALAAAEAAESVARRGGEDAFWAMHALLYQNQDALQHDDLIEYAAAVAVDPIGVADDLASAAMSHRVRRDVDSGERSRVSATPTFFVNGRRFEGDWTDPSELADALQDGTRGGTFTTH